MQINFMISKFSFPTLAEWILRTINEHQIMEALLLALCQVAYLLDYIFGPLPFAHVVLKWSLSAGHLKQAAMLLI